MHGAKRAGRRLLHGATLRQCRQLVVSMRLHAFPHPPELTKTTTHQSAGDSLDSLDSRWHKTRVMEGVCQADGAM